LTKNERGAALESGGEGGSIFQRKKKKDGIQFFTENAARGGSKRVSGKGARPEKKRKGGEGGVP